MRLDFHREVALQSRRGSVDRGSLASAALNIAPAQLQAMRLETEFRLCLQRRSLEWAFQQSSPDSTILESISQAAIAPSAWVKLLLVPTAYCSDEALLICQQSEQQWLAWIPDYGEILLDRRQFDPLI